MRPNWSMLPILRLSQGFEGMGNRAIYFRGTREQKSKTEGNRKIKAILGNRERRKKMILGDRGK